MGKIQVGLDSRGKWLSKGTLGVAVVSAGLGALACNSLDAPVEETEGPHLVVPTDTRAPLQAEKTPPPLAGGTLLVTRAGLAVASDPERDAIVVADVRSAALLGTIPLQAGDEPGRLVEDAAGLVHVALRRGGAVVTLDPTTRSVLYRRPVCGAPRGLAVSAPGTLTVACADGHLVTLPTAGGDVTGSVSLDPDLRDVVVTPSGLVVSRFRSAELLRLDAAESVARRDVLPKVFGSRLVPDPNASPADRAAGVITQITSPFRPLVAWRTLAGPNATTLVVHERAVEDEVDLTQPTSGASAYGSGSGCGGISENAVSIVSDDGEVTNQTIPGPPLAVDAALLGDGTTLAIAHAGPADPAQPHSFLVFDGDGSEVGPSGTSFGGGFTTTVSLLALPPSSPSDPNAVAPDPGCNFGNGIPIPAAAVAVASIPWRSQGLVVQTMQPSTLVFIDDASNGAITGTLSFDDGKTLDTGFQLFHSDSGAGIACASCHPEGREDGNVWHFKGQGARRTQALDVGLEGTAPFHWDGQLANVGALMDQVFVGRMGGVHENPARLATFQHWLFGLRPLPPLRSTDEGAVQHGAALFHSSGCATCHSGAHFTDNRTLAVGTHSTIPLQVPSLVGVGYRAPFLHDGCAATLLERFDPSCGGGDQHGVTSGLSAADLGDLVAYLESI